MLQPRMYESQRHAEVDMPKFVIGKFLLRTANFTGVFFVLQPSSIFSPEVSLSSNDAWQMIGGIALDYGRLNFLWC